jgi:SAM-dependent methyltransferase
MTDDERQAGPVLEAAGAGSASLPAVSDGVGRASDSSEDSVAAAVPQISTLRKGGSIPPPALDGDARSIAVTRSAARDSARRARAKQTLRIPDDEVARPTPSTPPVALHDGGSEPPTVYSTRPASMPAPVVEGGSLQPTRIISIGVSEAPAPNVRTPSQPPLRAKSDPPPVPRDTAMTPPPDSSEPLDLDEAETQALLSNRPPPVAVAPVTIAAAPAVPSIRPPDDAVADTARTLETPVARPRVATEPDGEDVSFEDEEASTAPTRSDRISETGDLAEISAEDMVSVESAPEPRRGPPSGVTRVAPPSSGQTSALQQPPPMRAKAVSLPNVPPPRPPLPVPQRGQLVIVPPHVGVTQPAADSASRRKGRSWWEELFNDDFIRTMAKITRPQIASEIDFIEDSLGVEKGGALLDLGCGTGLHAIELARRGYEVVGFDLSLAMLARAADEAQEYDQKLNFVQGDMREMTFDESFDGVYSWNTSFGYFDEETNAKVIAKVRSALKTGGQFLLDVINRDYMIRQAPSLAWFEGDGCICMDEMSLDWITSRMRVKRTMMMDDGRAKEIEYSIRVYSLHELGRILHEQGFKVVEVSGRIATPGVFFGNEAPRTLILAEKR